jgi:hypothetical protein
MAMHRGGKGRLSQKDIQAAMAIEGLLAEH